MALDLSLPEVPARRGGRLLPALTLLLVGTCLLLLVLLLLRPSGRTPGGEVREGPFGRELAETLEKRTLFGEAAALWEELARKEEDAATALFRAGKCRMLAGEPARGIRDLLAAESLGLPGDLAAESSRLVLEGYAVLGKFAVRNDELTRRTGGEEEPAPDVVARVGEERITRDELNAAVRDEEALRLLSAGGLDRASLDRAVAARVADPARLLPALERLVSRRVLSLEALAQGMGEEPELRRRLAETRRELLANLLVERRLLEGVQVSEEDLRDHWKAHPDRYTEPEAARFSWGPPGTTPEALESVEGWHAKGDPYPEGLGRSAEADALLFALEEGETAARTVRIGDRELLLRLLEKRPSRLVPFAEARERVAADLLARKRTEAIRSLRAEVEARHPVEILDEGLRKVYEAGRRGAR